MGRIKLTSSHMLGKFSASELDICPPEILHTLVSILLSFTLTYSVLDDAIEEEDSHERQVCSAFYLFSLT